MNYQNPPQKFPFDQSSSQGQQPLPVPMFQQMYYAQQQQIYGYETQPFPSLNYNGYPYYTSSKQICKWEVPQYNIPQQPTPVDSVSSNSISQSENKKKKKGKSDKSKKDKKKKKKRASSSSSSSSSSDSSSSSSKSRSRKKKRSLSFLHNEDNWKCKYCYNINFPHRTECNRCKKSREQAVKEEKGKKYIPNPDDWKCNICGNFNYARREKCNRCREDKPKATMPITQGNG